MLNDTINSIKKKIEGSKNLQKNNKQELLALIDKLNFEIIELSKTRLEDSESITQFTDTSTHEALRNNKNEQLNSIALDGLKKSVEKFETSHPELTKTINQICSMLANLGI